MVEFPACSLGTYFDRFFFNGRWNWFIMLLQTCKVTLNGIFDVRKYFFTICALRNTPRQRRALSHELAVFILLNGYLEFHLRSKQNYGLASYRFKVLIACSKMTRRPLQPPALFGRD